MKTLIVFWILLWSAETFLVAKGFKNEWEDFKDKFNKSYKNEAEELERFNVFINNLERIEESNRLYENGNVSYELGINQFADMTDKEFVDRFNEYVELEVNETSPNDSFNETLEPTNYFETPSDSIIPDSIDWRDLGAVTAVKNQGLCGSCWAFAAVGVYEGQYFQQTHNLLDFSAQNLIDCSPYNKGCAGGSVTLSFIFIGFQDGLNTEEAYPYEGANGKCRFSSENQSLPIMDIFVFPENDEEKLKAAVGIYGPVSIGLDASTFSFRFYKSGILDDPSCGLSYLGHAALVVGYGFDPEEGDFWIIKNSFGVDWGEEGFIKIARNKGNLCGVAADPAFLTL